MLTSILPAYVNKSRLLTYQYWSNFIAIPKLKQGGLMVVSCQGATQDSIKASFNCVLGEKSIFWIVVSIRHS